MRSTRRPARMASIILMLGALLACDDIHDATSGGVLVSQLRISPACGVPSTDFQLELLVSVEGGPFPDQLESRVDWEGDGVFDTDWESRLIWVRKYLPGTHSPVVVLRDPLGRTGRQVGQLLVEDPISILEWSTRIDVQGWSEGGSNQVEVLLDLELSNQSLSDARQIRVSDGWLIPVGTQDTLIHFPASAFVPVGSDFLPLDDAWDAVLQANQAIELNYWLLHDDLPAERWPCGRNAWLFLRLTMGECGQEILIRTPADLFQCNSDSSD